MSTKTKKRKNSVKSPMSSQSSSAGKNRYLNYQVQTIKEYFEKLRSQKNYDSFDSDKTKSFHGNTFEVPNYI